MNAINADNLFGTVSHLLSMGRGLAVTNLGEMDNEMLTQIFLNNLYSTWTLVGDPEEALRMAKVAMGATGYSLSYENIERYKLAETIYYARVSRAGLFRNPFHPFHLLEGMPGAPPASYLTLFNNGDYLPNVVSVLDPTGADRGGEFVYLVRLQKLNIMVRDTINDPTEVINGEEVLHTGAGH